jgi:hypothetical protein
VGGDLRKGATVIWEVRTGSTLDIFGRAQHARRQDLGGPSAAAGFGRGRMGATERNRQLKNWRGSKGYLVAKFG